MMMVLASFALMVQGRVLEQNAVVAGLIDRQRTEAAEASALAYLTPMIGEAILAEPLGENTDLPLNGEAVEIEIDGAVWEVQVQDLAALPDLSDTSGAAFDILFPDVPELSGDAILAIRGQVVSVDQALVALGVTGEEAARLRPLLTLANPGSDIAVARVPAGLEAQAEDLPRVLVTGAGAEDVEVSLKSVSQ